MLNSLRLKGKGRATASSTPQSATEGEARIQPRSALSSTPDETLTLWCLPDGESRPFDITVLNTREVRDLRTLIWEAGKTQSFATVDAKDLILWKLNEYENLLPQDDLAQRINNRVNASGGRLSDIASDLWPMVPLLDVFPKQPAQACVHIIVQRYIISATNLTPQRDVTTDLLVRWSKPAEYLPSLTQLRGLLDQPLREDERVPIADQDLQELQSHDVRDLCGRDNAEVLFRTSGSEHSRYLFSFFLAITRQPAPPNSGTEASFHSLWDDNIRKVLDLLLPTGISIRDSNLHTSAKKLRPDFGFLLNNVCLFRGEEKSPTDSEDPKAELCDKLTWIYSPAPYIFAYYAVGSQVTLCAICAPKTPSSRPYVEDLAVANLQLMRERIMHLRRIIRLSRYVPLLLDLVGYRSDPEFLEIRRGDKIVEIGLKSVKKTYLYSNARVRHLQIVYKALQDKQVPHTDHLTHSFDATVYLEPKGIAVRPSNEMELLESLICVLQALQVLHRDPPLFHRDIRWPNVIRSAHDRSLWFLVDWEDAAASNNFAAMHLDPRTHSPQVFSDNHGGEVDIWGVGLLIKESRSFAFNVSKELLALGQWMQDDQPNAHDALAAIMKYKNDCGLMDIDSHVQ